MAHQAEKQRLFSADAQRLFVLQSELRNGWNQLTNQQRFDQEMMAMVDLLDKTRLKWLESSNKNDEYKQQLSRLEVENRTLGKAVQASNAQLKDARAQIAHLMTTKKAMELDKSEMDMKMEQGEGGLQLSKQDKDRLAFLRSAERPPADGSSSSSIRQSFEEGLAGDIDYDQTADSLDAISKGSLSSSNDSTASEDVKLRSGHIYRRSNTPQPKDKKRSHQMATPIAAKEQGVVIKRMKPAESKANLATPTATALPRTSTRKQPIDQKARRQRSISVPYVNTQAISTPENDTTNRTPRLQAVSTLDLRTPTLKSWVSGISLETRSHSFAQKTMLLREYCDVCSQRIGFGQATMKCTDCKTTTHKQCCERAALPCVPCNFTPKTPTNGGGNNAQQRLADFCPSDPPMIPAILIHCVVALERKHMNFAGLYRISGSERLVADLLNKFRHQRAPPRLDLVDPETITSCIKKFLDGLREPVIPTASWREFVRAAAQYDEGESLSIAVADLPMPHRDTLAFMCLHWQKVAEHADTNMMPLENLARCLAPTIVGYSQAAMKDQEETRKVTEQIISVLFKLLKLPAEFWRRFVIHDETVMVTPQAGTMKRVNRALVLDTEMVNSPEINNSSLLGPMVKNSNAPSQTMAPSRMAGFFPRIW